MAAAINKCEYPYTEQVKNLPVYLTGIGGTEWQGHIIREKGYCWHQIFFCANGSGILKYDNATYRISKNCILFLPADYPHEYYPEEIKWDMCYVTFTGYACRDILINLKMTVPMMIQADKFDTLKKLYDKIFATLKSDKVYGNYTCSGLVYSYILEFHKLVSNISVKSGSEKSNILMPALNYIDNNFRSDFSIATLAAISGVSHQYLCRLFKETMNLRPNEYITQRRLNEAKRLLSMTDMPISEVSVQSGFSDTGYFCTVFRRYESMTPSEYRASLKTPYFVKMTFKK